MTAPTQDYDVGNLDEDAAVVRPVRRDVERNRHKIIEAAREVLAERGLALTLNEVAHHAGVGVGTVYRHFPDKNALIDAALAEQLEAFVVIVEECMTADSAWDGLVQAMTRGMASHVGNRGLRDVALVAVTDEQKEAAINRVNPLMEQLVARAHAEGSLRPDISLSDLTMIHFMITELADHSSHVQPDLYQRYLRLFIEAVRARPDAADLGAPPDDEQTHAIATAWITSHRTRAR